MAERQRTAGASVQGWCMFAITSDEDGTVAVVLQPGWMCTARDPLEPRPGDRAAEG